ncbi:MULTISPECIES: 50S ribosomal protein L25 [Paenibacillus]|uniref:Large ribosomal subunit protein bL25 n=1 Tax=Paenibacillus radicis (ex Xue et al. 2023) TaxID=2972489 RepID=A0ABT1YUN7_9BACL|nr:50S ribosomal protein L25 [Paenibacillus radicis (ex Xue et al. 2023)]MCR8636105.1 50S ribosomal protein L25 [Paenibacillus radicis (ex Xue et al. 2023)]
MTVTMKAEERNRGTKSERKGLRAKGKIPAVLYGSKVSSTPIAISEKELLVLLRSNPHAIIEMDVPQIGKQPVMISEVQRDALSRSVLHVDFHQINMDEPVTTTVRLDFTGESAGVQAGGILQIQHHEIEIRCLPRDIPASIQVDISALEIGTNVLVSELQLPATIEIKTDMNDVLATVLMPQKEVIADDAEDEKDQKAEAVPAGAADQE